MMNMSPPSPEARPAKKRRFFVEGSSDQDHGYPASDIASSPPRSKPAATENGAGIIRDANPESSAIDSSEVPSFDIDVLNAIAGETLPSSTVDKLRDLSNDNIERGESGSFASSAIHTDAMIQPSTSI
jgi:hypothetical protein